MSIIETIHRRTSCRTYGSEPIELDKLAAIKAALNANTVSPFGSPVRFQLLDLRRLAPDETRTLGTYGVIRGAVRFIAGAVRYGPKAMEDFGYCMEKNILEATALGLGTCWLGGTFSRTGFAVTMNLADDELLPAVSPVGYPADRRSFTDRFFRFSAGSNRRLPWRKLFFDGDAQTPLSADAAGPYAKPLDCVRTGPSASNMQPWRIVRQNGRFHFYLRRTSGYRAVSGKISLQNIDMGIALCHFELASAELGLRGRWQIADPGMDAGGMEYIATRMTGAPGEGRPR